MHNTIESLLWQASAIMFTGMMVVFLFLTALVYLVRLMSRFISQESRPENEHQPHHFPNTDVEPQVIAVISAAINRYRTDSQK